MVTTSIEETWCEDTPIMFLGEWCKLYSRKSEWEKIESMVLPYHWDDRAKFDKDYHCIDEIYERLLTDLSIQLNAIHNVNYGVRYWRILIGPWLGYFVQILFDRWFMIQEAVDTGFPLKTIILKVNEEKLVPNDMAEFSLLISSDIWNHFIYSKIIDRHSSKIKIEKRDYFGHVKATEKGIPIRKRIKRSIARIYLKATHYLSKPDGPLFLSTYLSLKDQINLSWRFRQFPLLPNFIDMGKVQPVLEHRNWQLPYSGTMDFESFARSLIPLQIPAVYLEGYSMLRKRSKEMYWPKNPSVIFTSNSYSSDEIFKIYAAENTEKNTPLVIGQHGGHYGSGKRSFVEDHEIDICNSFLSWGWSDSAQSKVNPVGILTGIKSGNIRPAPVNGALLVTSVPPRYSYFMFSAVISSQWLEYFDDQCKFVNSLQAPIREQLTVRLYKNDYGWDQRLRWRENFKDLELDMGLSNIQKEMLKSKLCIGTYNATTYLESFALDIPTIIYWNANQWELRNSAVSFFEELMHVGIFHDTPESAANHVNRIWGNIDAWWNSIEVRNAVLRFSEQFCKIQENLVDKIEVELKQVITNSGKKSC